MPFRRTKEPSAVEESTKPKKSNVKAKNSSKNKNKSFLESSDEETVIEKGSYTTKENDEVENEENVDPNPVKASSNKSEENVDPNPVKASSKSSNKKSIDKERLRRLLN